MIPHSSFIAQLVLETIIPKLPFKLPFSSRFVDDCLTAISAIITKKLNQNSIVTTRNCNLPHISTLHKYITTKQYTKCTWSGNYRNHNAQLQDTRKI